MFRKTIMKNIAMFIAVTMFLACISVTASAQAILPGGFEWVGYDSDDFPFAFDIQGFTNEMVTVQATPKASGLGVGEIIILSNDDFLSYPDRAISVVDGVFTIATDTLYSLSALFFDEGVSTYYSCGFSAETDTPYGYNYLVICIQDISIETASAGLLRVGALSTTIYYWDEYNIIKDPVATPGTFRRQVSSTNYNAYPQNGSNGTYWYKYTGSKVVPTVSLSSPTSSGSYSVGSQINVSATATTPCYKMWARVTGPGTNLLLGDVFSNIYNKTFTPTQAGDYMVSVYAMSYASSDPKSAEGLGERSFVVRAAATPTPRPTSTPTPIPSPTVENGGLFAVVDAPARTLAMPRGATNTIAATLSTAANNLLYLWEFKQTSGAPMSPRQWSNSYIPLGSNRNLNVSTPNTPGKYRLDIEVIDSNNNAVLSLVFTVYVTHGPVRGNQILVSKGVNVYWLDKAFPRQGITVDDSYSELNVAIYRASAPYGNGDSLTDDDRIQAISTTVIPEGNCGNFAQLLSQLAEIFGIQPSSPSSVSIRTTYPTQNEYDHTFYCAYFMMTPDRRAISGQFNAIHDTKASESNGVSRKEEGVWIFSSHSLTRFNNRYYDPTFGLEGSSIITNVYAMLSSDSEKHNGIQTYRVLTLPYDSTKVEYRIAATNSQTGYGYWATFSYYYIPISSTSSISGGETKTLAISNVLPLSPEPSGSPSAPPSWSAHSNDNWISVAETTIDIPAIGDYMQMMTTDEIDGLEVTTEPNPSILMRTGTITVNTSQGSDTIHVHQDGINPWINVSRPEVYSSRSGGVSTISIDSNVNWVAMCSEEWVMLDYSLGVGDDELPYSIAENETGQTRYATIVLVGDGVTETVRVEQSPDSVQPNTYTIDYDANGGIGAPEQQTKMHDVELTLSPTIPNRAGFEFMGWSTDPGATMPAYLSGGAYTENDSAMLYAVWVAASPVADYEMELEISSEYLVEYYKDYETEKYFVLLSGHSNIVALPDVFRLYPDGSRTSISGMVEDIKYFLDGVEYDTLAVGELGEIDWVETFLPSRVMTITAKLVDGTEISQSFTFDIYTVIPVMKARAVL